MRLGAVHILSPKKIDSSVGKNINFLENNVVNTLYKNELGNLPHKWCFPDCMGLYRTDPLFRKKSGPPNLVL
jgi:hypothetical protein